MEIIGAVQSGTVAVQMIRGVLYIVYERAIVFIEILSSVSNLRMFTNSIKICTHTYTQAFKKNNVKPHYVMCKTDRNKNTR